MRVKKLEIFGFKSFANRQSIIFGKGLTCVVGPNGCGKSNVVDALRWVMGEQNARHLRGGNMQDIIFCGSEKKAPLGFAEVTLTLENNSQDAPLDYNHYNEIEITRRLYKTGESEYEINRQKSRLKDISDFFLGTGVGTKAYSIIEQGRVNDLISAKASDRRAIIEEAAGITKYKTKKAVAERRIEATKINLGRITDIKHEIDKHVAALMRDKEKLEKAQAIKNKIRDLDLHLTSHHYLARYAELSWLKTSKKKLSAEIAANKQDIAIAEHSFSKILDDYTKKHDQKKLLEDIEGQHKNSLELLKKDLEHTKITFGDNQILVARITSQLNDIEQRRVELEADISRFSHEHEINLAQRKEIDEKFYAKKQSGQAVVESRQNNFVFEQNIQKKIIDAATTATRLQTEITVTCKQDLQKKLEIKNVALELVTKTEELNISKKWLDSLTNELGEECHRNQALKDQLSDQSSKLSKENDAKAIIMTQLRNLEQEKILLVSRLKSLKEIDDNCEWSDSGISELLASDKKYLIRGIIADAIQVKQGYEDIVEKCLAHMLDTAIIETNNDLNIAADFLKKKRSAKTSFILLSNSEPRLNIARPIGLKNLCELIYVPKIEHSGLLPQLARFFLADDLASAIDHWPAARISLATIVTSAGEMLLPDGQAIIAGDNNGSGVLKRKNEMIELEKSILVIAALIKESSHQAEATSQIILELEAGKNKFLQEIKLLSMNIVRLEEASKQKSHELKRLEEELGKLEEKNSSLNQSVINSDEKVAILRKEWAIALESHKRFEDELENIRSQRSAVDAEYEAYQQEIKEIEVAMASIYEKSQSLSNALAQAEKNLLHLQSQKQAFDDQIDEKSDEGLKLKESERQIDKKIVALSKDVGETSRMLVALREECTIIAEQKLAKEQALASLQSQDRASQQRLYEQELQINNADHQIKNLCDRIMERYKLKLSEQLSDFHHSPIDEASAKKEINELYKASERMGAVNENADKDFDEFSARRDFLQSQIGDLSDALCQLEDAIKKINQTTKMRFIEAFNSINQQFSLVFPRLFSGGKAELTLCGDQDPLNCGVDIMAQPPGKSIGSIELMSGGEKALTAISLIIAIFLVKPSPFCLLDEVDAPLDEANVYRFSQLIKEMSELSQFIVITHNRKTMEVADQLYGVTMEDAGMSKIVSVQVQQAFDTFKQPNKALPGGKKTAQLFFDGMIT